MGGSDRKVVLSYKFHQYRVKLSGFQNVGVEICHFLLLWPLAYLECIFWIGQYWKGKRHFDIFYEKDAPDKNVTGTTAIGCQPHPCVVVNWSDWLTRLRLHWERFYQQQRGTYFVVRLVARSKSTPLYVENYFVSRGVLWFASVVLIDHLVSATSIVTIARALAG